MEANTFLMVVFFIYAGFVINRDGYLEGLLNIIIVACIAMLAIKGATE